MRIAATGAALEPAAVVRAVGSDAIVAAEGSSTDRRTFGIGGAGTAKRDIAAAWAAVDRAANAVAAFETAAAGGSARAPATFVAATVQRTVASDAVVGAEDGTAVLAALGGCGADAAQPDRSARAAAGATDAVGADEPAAAVALLLAVAPFIVAAVERSVAVVTI
jgi:hypothetical protein